MVLEWNDNLATGHADIDHQHRELFARISRLLTACAERKGRSEVLNLFTFLDEYVRSHFDLEERFQRDHAYPGYPGHKAQHEQFIRDLQDLEQQLQDDGATLTLVIKTNQTMISWLINHINVADRELAAFLRGHA